MMAYMTVLDRQFMSDLIFNVFPFLNELNLMDGTGKSSRFSPYTIATTILDYQ